jgi:hypothetical protein
LSIGIDYGAPALMTVDLPARLVQLNANTHAMGPGHNAILIDQVDSGKPRFVETLAVDQGDANADPQKGSLSALFNRAPVAAAFVRCDARIPGGGSFRYGALLCDDLKR